MRAVGRDPALVAKTLAAAREEAEARKPELIAEGRRLAQEKGRLATQRENVLDAVANGGSAADALLQRVAELDAQLATLDECRQEVTAELVAIESGTVHEADLAQALARFDPVWGELIPREQARLLRLLVEAVVYDPDSSEVAITFRAAGIRSLAAEDATA